MKKTIFLFSLQLFFILCMAQKVTITGKQFRLNGSRFYPVVMNYDVNGVNKNGNFFISPTPSYNATDYYECDNSSDCYDQIETDFSYIAGMGFNAIRVKISPSYIQGHGLVFTYHPYDKYHQQILFPVNPFIPSDPGMLSIFSYYDKILELADAASLKVIVITTIRSPELDEIEVDMWSAYVATVASTLKNSNYRDALLAYDLMNEPAYFVKPPKTKQEACGIISTWYDAIKNEDPQSLITIGNCGLADIWSFDPSILKVDFNSLHYYPYQNMQPYEDRTQSSIQQKIRARTANNLYWFNQVSIVPWIVGETGFSASGIQYGIANGLDGTLTDQGNYVTYSLDAVCNCGGSGYSWWQYQDVYWHNQSSATHGRNFLSLLERWMLPSPAAEKQPAVDIFRNYFNNLPPQSTGICPVDYTPIFDETNLYYNRYGHTAPNNLKITRHIIDQDGNPIKDAVVRVTTDFGRDTVTIMVNGVPKDTAIWRYNEYYTHTDVNGKFTAIPCPTRYGFIGHGTIPTSHPEIRYIRVSAAGAEVKTYGKLPPNIIELNKIKDDVVVTGETVLSGQTKVYKGRKSLTVKNTTVNSGGTAYFSSQKNITLLPGFTAHAGSHVYLYITPPNCNEMPLREESRENMLVSKTSSSSTMSNQIELSFAPEFSENYISVFPNPTNSTVTVQLHSNNTEASLTSIKLMNLLGRELLWQQVSEQSNASHVLDLSIYPKGIYFIEIKDSNTSYYKKIIKQ